MDAATDVIGPVSCYAINIGGVRLHPVLVAARIGREADEPIKFALTWKYF